MTEDKSKDKEQRTEKSIFAAQTHSDENADQNEQQKRAQGDQFMEADAEPRRVVGFCKRKWDSIRRVSANQITAVATVGIFLASLIYAGFSYLQWTATQDNASAARRSAELANSALQVTNRAYVTIGRKDGVIADFIVPKDRRQKAEIVIYFQNTGHIPAKFTWGPLVNGPFLAQGSKKLHSGIVFTRPDFTLFSRTRNVKDGSIGERGESTIIAGDSVLESSLGVISQENLEDFRPNNMGVFMIGQYYYCDELGNESFHMFGLSYTSSSATRTLGFHLANDSSLMLIPHGFSNGKVEDIFPCETITEREQQQQKNTKQK